MANLSFLDLNCLVVLVLRCWWGYLEVFQENDMVNCAVNWSNHTLVCKNMTKVCKNKVCCRYKLVFSTKWKWFSSFSQQGFVQDCSHHMLGSSNMTNISLILLFFVNVITLTQRFIKNIKIKTVSKLTNKVVIKSP